MSIKELLEELAEDADSAQEMSEELADWISTADDSEIDELADFLAKPFFADGSDEGEEPEEIEEE
jgi:hypothetical protein